MIWVYAICERSTRLPAVPGREHARLQGITHGPLLAVGSRSAPETKEPAADALQAHARVVDALMDEHTVLPARFGTQFADRLAVRAALAVRRVPLETALVRVAGCVEIAVRANTPEPTAVPAGDGRAYVQSKLRERRLAAAVHEPLAERAVAARIRPASVRGELLRAAYLIPSEEAAAFCAAAAQLEREHPPLVLSCTGPWPAYSFVDEGSER